MQRGGSSQVSMPAEQHAVSCVARMFICLGFIMVAHLTERLPRHGFASYACHVCTADSAALPMQFGMKLLYCSGVWSYVVGALSTPTFIIIPLITIWAGIFPIVISWWAALGLTVYMLATMLVRTA